MKTYQISEAKKRSGWYWKITHRNGNSVAIGGQGYSRRTDARRSLNNLIQGIAGGDYELASGAAESVPQKIARSIK